MCPVKAAIAFGLIAIAAICSIVGCAAEDSMPQPATPENRDLLAEVERSGGWFHARKVRPIWARQLAADVQVDTLEGRVTASAGDYLCRGEAGEVWPQKAATLEARYTASGALDAEGWRQYEPRPDAEGVWAARVDHSFSVQASWGTLRGKPGDFVVKNYADRDVAAPADVWIVEQALFAATYAPVD